MVGEDPEIYARNTKQALEDRHTVSIVAEAGTAAARTGNVGLIVVSLSLQDTDGLRLCSQLRAMDESRQILILILIHDTPN
jgi:two-component system cell cycle response regulator